MAMRASAEEMLMMRPPSRNRRQGPLDDEERRMHDCPIGLRMRPTAKVHLLVLVSHELTETRHRGTLQAVTVTVTAERR